MYGGSFAKWCADCEVSDAAVPSIVKAIAAEMKAVANALRELNPELYAANTAKRAAEGKTHNVECSFAAVCFQHFERLALETMVGFLEREGYIRNGRCVLCHDGVMIEHQTLPNDLLERMSACVKEKTGFALDMKYKAFDEALDAFVVPRSAMSFEETEKVAHRRVLPRRFAPPLPVLADRVRRFQFRLHNELFLHSRDGSFAHL